MGSSSYSQGAAKHIQQTQQTQSTDQIFKQNAAKKVAATMSPVDLKIRESRDSDANPESLGIIVGLDDTGSMGDIPAYLIKNTLPTLMETIIKHGTPYPHVMFMGVGDKLDDAPIQVGQFEAGAQELNDCLASVWLEGNGHGDKHEAYPLVHLIAARHTSIDCFEKRGLKGILFTVGDEAPHAVIPSDRLKQIMGYTEANDLKVEEIIREAERLYHVFHIHVEEGSYPSESYPELVGEWQKLLPERVILMKDKTQLAEIIGTTVALIHGADLEEVVKDFDANTAAGVTTALAHISTGIQKNQQQTGALKV